MVLGLLLITATGMIINTIENVAEAKHLVCPPFKTGFCCTTENILAIEVNATSHYVEFEDVHGILKKTIAFITGVCDCHQLVKSSKVRLSAPHRPVEALSNFDSMTTMKSIAGQ